MLSIQSSINSVQFGNQACGLMSPEDRQRLQSEREEFLRQRAEFEAMSQDSFAPDAMKKIAKAGAILTAGAAVGLTAGGGTKILINKAKAFKNSDFMKHTKEYAKSFTKAYKDSMKAIKKNFKKSDVYKKPANYLDNKFEAFSKSKFGEPVVKFVKTIGNMIKAGFKQIKNGKDFVTSKIKSVKSETYENIAVGTVGVSSGACAAINSLKENQEAGE